MNAEWIKSATARRIVAHWSDTRPAWLWDQDGTDLLWRNAAARYYLGKIKKSGPKPGAEPVPIRGQIARLIRLGSRGRASLSRIQLLAGDRPISMTALCTPLELPERGTALLIVGVDPIDPDLLDQVPLTPDDPLETSLLPAGSDWLVINEDSQITSGSPAAIARYAEEIESEGLPQPAAGEELVQLGGDALRLTRFAASPHDSMLLLFQHPVEPPAPQIDAVREAEGVHPELHPTADAAAEDRGETEDPVADQPMDRPGEDESVVPQMVTAEGDAPEAEAAPETGSLASLFDRLADDDGLYGALSEADELFAGPDPVPPETVIGGDLPDAPSLTPPVAIADPGEVDTDVDGDADLEADDVVPAGEDVHADPIGSLIADADADAWSALKADAEELIGESAAPEAETDGAPDPDAETAEAPEIAAAPPVEPAPEPEPEPEPEPKPEAPAAADEPPSDAPAEVEADAAPLVWRVIGRGFTAASDAAAAGETAPPETLPDLAADPDELVDAQELAELAALDAAPSGTGSAPAEPVDPDDIVDADELAELAALDAAPSDGAPPEQPADPVEAFAEDLADEAPSDAVPPDESATEPSPLEADNAAPPQEPTLPEDGATKEDQAQTLLDAETVERVSRYNFDELTRILTDRVAAPPIDATGTADSNAGLVNLAGETFILNRLPLGILVFRDQQVLFANRALTELTGHTSIESLRQAGLASVFPGEDSTQAGPVTHLLRSDGELMAVSARLQSISWHGRPALMLSASPLENRIGHEGAVRTFSELSAAVREDGYIAADRNGLVTLVSLHGRMMLGETEDDLVGRPLAALVPPDTLGELRSFLELPARFAETSRPAVVLPSLVKGVELQLFAEGQAGIVAGYFGFVHRRQRPEAAPASPPKPTAASSEDIEPSMLVRISRGVRRPLNTVIGFSDMIRSSGAADTQRTLEYVRDIQSAGEEIAALVDELDDFARLREGRYDLKSDETDLGALLASCLHRVRGQAAAARVLVRSAVSERLPHIVVDRPSMTQAMLNLLASAIDQTPAGGTVILSAQLEDDGAVVINVRDNGQRRTDLGERFVVFRDGVGREGEVLAPVRSSVGLALTRSLLAVNALSLSVDPAVGSGTLFSLVVPDYLVRA